MQTNPNAVREGVGRLFGRLAKDERLTGAIHGVADRLHHLADGLRERLDDIAGDADAEE